MAKPIFLIKLNRNAPPEKSEEIKAKVTQTLQSEYHVLVACCLDQGVAEFECFNTERMPQTTIDEIKESIKP